MLGDRAKRDKKRRPPETPCTGVTCSTPKSAVSATVVRLLYFFFFFLSPESSPPSVRPAVFYGRQKLPVIYGETSRGLARTIRVRRPFARYLRAYSDTGKTRKTGPEGVSHRQWPWRVNIFNRSNGRDPAFHSFWRTICLLFKHFIASSTSVT